VVSVLQRIAEPRTVDVLVILDGASEPVRDGPTSLERAHTLTLDGLAADGELLRLRTVAASLPAGSESAIPALLGWVPDAPVDRGAIEAAAYVVEVGERERAWRVDRRDRQDAGATALALAWDLREAGETDCRLHGVSRYRVYHLSGHRMLVVGPEVNGAPGLLRNGARAGGISIVGPGPKPMPGGELFVWPQGVIPPSTLDARTVVIGARGAAIGIARLMGARTVVPAGATGRPGTVLAAKAAAAIDAIDGGAARVVVHVGAPDEAAHERDADAKVAAIEAADALLLAPLAETLGARCTALGAGAATLQVCPDHGCDPATGLHDGAPVPCLRWPFAPVHDQSATRADLRFGEPRPADAQLGNPPQGEPPFERWRGERLTERAVAHLPVIDLASVKVDAPRRALAHERPVLA
jgi:2,3-bisphosphoglycerate-independent phosphoglycerate mutase